MPRGGGGRDVERIVFGEAGIMADVVALAGGGIRSVVAAVGNGRDADIVFVHINYGQASAKRERVALLALIGALPHARGVAVELPYVPGLERYSEGEDGSFGTDEYAAVGAPEVTGAMGLRGLFPTMLSIASHCAIRFGAPLITTGLMETKETVSPLLSFTEGQPGRLREFLQTYNMMIETMLPERAKMRVECPLLELTYAEALSLGQRLGVPFEHTWSCEKGGSTPCIDCSSCKARYNAFADARLSDALVIPAGKPV